MAILTRGEVVPEIKENHWVRKELENEYKGSCE